MLNHKKARRAPKIAAFITARLYLCKIKETITIAPKAKKRVPAASPSNPSVSFAEKAVATKIKRRREERQKNREEYGERPKDLLPFSRFQILPKGHQPCQEARREKARRGANRSPPDLQN